MRRGKWPCCFSVFLGPRGSGVQGERGSAPQMYRGPEQERWDPAEPCLGTPVSARCGVPVVEGCHLHPKSAPTHPPLPRLLLGGSVDVGWASLSRAGPFASFRPPFRSVQSWGVGEGSLQSTLDFHLPKLQGQISCQENTPVLSQRAALWLHVLSFELLLTSLLSFLLCWCAVNGQGPVCLRACLAS